MLRNLIIIFAFCSIFSANSQTLQPDAKLARQLEDSHNLKFIMKPFWEDAGLTRWSEKKVFESRSLSLVSDSIRHSGQGTMYFDSKVTISGKGSVRVDTPTSLDRKSSSNRSYGSAGIFRLLDNEDISDYNRFSAWIYVDAPGFHTLFVGFSLNNRGEKIIPVPGRFEGQHYENVYPGRWQRVIWEIPDLSRDCVTGFSVSISLSGSPAGASETMSLYIDDMRIEKVEAENSRGFDLRKDAVAYSHSGYKTGTRKQAVVQNVKSNDFKLYNEKGEVAFEGKGLLQKNGFTVLDFSAFDNPGFYTISVDGINSKPFAIGDTLILPLHGAH